MISVAEAISKITQSFTALPSETISLENGLGRVICDDLIARRTQPPFSVSAMDGFAVKASDIKNIPQSLLIIGSVPAGTKLDDKLEEGQAVRIFTGARIPEGADSVIIQENTELSPNKKNVIIKAIPQTGDFIRNAGLDFTEGETLIKAGTRLNARSLGLVAAMNIPWINVVQLPRVAILSNGDEIVLPGERIGENQIVSSNGVALSAAIKSFGALPIQIGIAKDTTDSLYKSIEKALSFDLLVTTGGASVGDHDLVKKVLEKLGLDLEFWKIAMRPGKPLMFGSIENTNVIGLPGNPVSALICAQIFIKPAIEKMLGSKYIHSKDYIQAKLTLDLPKNDEREDYLRGIYSVSESGQIQVNVFKKQDSSMGSLLAKANCLVIRKPNAPAIAAGKFVTILRLPNSWESI
tara:strand:+ start:33790 stop:35013 length:1224 start_codon:yes stop_codon:yes gene_type:complete